MHYEQFRSLNTLSTPEFSHTPNNKVQNNKALGIEGIIIKKSVNKTAGKIMIRDSKHL